MMQSRWDDGLGTAMTGRVLGKGSTRDPAIQKTKVEEEGKDEFGWICH
jgi:hypothetical protein